MYVRRKIGLSGKVIVDKCVRVEVIVCEFEECRWFERCFQIKGRGCARVCRSGCEREKRVIGGPVTSHRFITTGRGYKVDMEGWRRRGASAAPHHYRPRSPLQPLGA